MSQTSAPYAVGVGAVALVGVAAASYFWGKRTELKEEQDKIGVHPYPLDRATTSYMRKKARLGYWKIRGLAQPIRFLLEYVQEPYDEELYERGGPPEFDQSSWLEMKGDMWDFDFPNLPYLSYDKFNITQSQAILRFFGRKYRLLGKNSEEMVAVDMLLEVARDFGAELRGLCYNSSFKELKQDFLSEKLPVWLNQLERYLGNKDWFCSDAEQEGPETPTVADFVLYEQLDLSRNLCFGCLNRHRGLRHFMNRFEQLPNIKAYMKSDHFSRRPFNNTTAPWRA